MKKISVVIITRNEEHNLRRCLESLKWADEIVLVDSGSTDRTLEIADAFGCRNIDTEWLGFGRTKQLAVDHASNDWILSVDADEVVTDALKDRILDILSGEPAKSGYRIRRSSFYLGKEIRYSGWNRDYPKRLFNRQKGKFNDKEVHESVQIEGETGRIEEPLLHYTYPTVASHLDKMNRYTDISAQTLHAKGARSTLFGAILRGKWKFFRMYILQGGFMDGKAGLILALNSAYGVFLKYLKLWKLNR